MTSTEILPPPLLQIKRINPDVLRLSYTKGKRIKHLVKRFVLSRVCKSCHIGYSAHGVFCATLLNIPYPKIMHALVSSYKEMPAHSGTVVRLRRYN